jgi:hypothetical protein
MTPRIFTALFEKDGTIRPFLILLIFLLSLAVSPMVRAQEVGEIAAGSTTTPTSTISEIVDAADSEVALEIDRISGRVDLGDFVVGPGRTVLELRPGETRIVYLSITNRISEDRRFELQVEDMTGSQDPNQGLVMLGDVRGPYSIRDYVQLPVPSFVLSLGERARVPVEISIPADAEPGGYYGAVFVSTTRVEADLTAVNTAQSPIVARIGAQFFITVPGEVISGASLRSVSLANDRWWYSSGPISVILTTENTGSIHLSQGADMTITNMFGEEVGYVQVEPWFVLPQAVRLRELVWDREFLLGRYQAEVRVGLGYDDIVETRTVTFWVLPWQIVGSVFGVSFVIIFSLRLFFSRFEFKRKDT